MLSKVLLAATLVLSALAARPSSLIPSRGALIVRQSRTRSGEFSTISDAVRALGNSSAPKTIFVHAGVYAEQVSIDYPGPLTIVGETLFPLTYKHNLVKITTGLSANTTGSNDLSATLRVHKDDFQLYNVIVENTFGHPIQQSQALALSAYGLRQGFYASSFTGWQDTILTDIGSQYFGSCLVTGATDYIFGETAATYFKNADIQSLGKGYITAGRPKNDGTGSYPGIYVFDSCTVTQGANAELDLTGLVYLGRPWGEYSRSIFKSSYLSDIVNPAGWSVWSTKNASDERTGHVTFGEYRNFGPGAETAQRANFSSVLTPSQAAQYTIQKVLGSDWAKWVDKLYF